MQVENEALVMPLILVLDNLDRAEELIFCCYVLFWFCFHPDLKIVWSFNCCSERKSLLPLFFSCGKSGSFHSFVF